VITVKSAFRGYNPTITLLNGTVTLTAGSVTAAVAGGAFIPGDVVSVGKVGSEWQVQMFNPTAGDRLPIGILVNDNGYPYHTHKDMADNRVWNVMLTGTIWVTQGGSTPVDADDFAIGISGTRMPTTLLPLTGKFLGASGWDVTGTLPILGKWDRGAGASVDGLNKFSTQDVGVLPGQTFRVTLK
jgi:hypothetical protein